ncbi:MAG: glycosyltransferase family 2 protein [Candidatus Yanofskybacteria bacterium]|nr:glycosyltransferase family 2 protein [Candidatus Yanofskybacteria bacterium]
MYLSVIIPAYNEAKRIGSTVRSVCEWLSRQEYDWEVIVVDNRSTDGTADAVREVMQQFHAIRLIQEKRPGKGRAVTAGMLFATGRVRLFMDADSSTTIDHFAQMKPLFEHGTDVVIGSLAAPGATVVRGGAEPLWRVVLGKLGNLWIQAWAVPGIWDTQRGFKAFTARAAQEIFSRLTIFGWGFDVEVLTCARQRGFRIAEIPVTWNNPPDTHVNVWTYPKVLLDTVRVGFRRFSRAYTH